METPHAVSCNQVNLLTCVTVHSYRRSYSLDVEVSASGFTKDLERDAALLHPTVPEGEEEDEEEGDDEEATEEEVGKEEESLDMEEYKHAMLELEGLKLSDLHVAIEDKESESESEEEQQKETQIAPSARTDDETKKVLEEELNEEEDECPELEDLSAFNKEFKPFR